MSVFLLPAPVGGSAVGWHVSDFLDFTLTTQPASGGTATANGPQLQPGTMWLLTHMVCACTSTAATRVRLYLDTPAPGNLRDGSDAGNFDVADWPGPGLVVPQSRTLVAVWTGADDGALGTLTVQGQIMRQS